MKTVTGAAVSSTPISLSKAASTLSAFLSGDNGASQPICSYLRRASASFNELKHLHKGRHSLKYGKTALESAIEKNKKKKMEEDAISGGAMAVSDRKGKKRKNLEQQQGTKRRKGSLL